MKVESFGAIAGNQRDLHREVVEILKTSNNVFFIKEGVTLSKEDLHLLNCFALFESEMLIKRQKAGRDKAKKNGVHMGRPEITEKQKTEIKKRRLSGEPMKSVAKGAGVSVNTAYRYSKS